jgi:hypothetical protein
MYNEAFRVVFMNNHFLHTCPQAAERALGGLGLGPLQGASMWLRKEHPQPRPPEDAPGGGSPGRARTSLRGRTGEPGQPGSGSSRAPQGAE